MSIGYILDEVVDVKKRLESVIKDEDNIDIDEIEDIIYTLDLLEIDIEKVQDELHDCLY